MTGGLDAMTREECWGAIEAAGGFIAKSVTKKTTVLVIGAGAEESMPPLLGENRKELKAISLIEAGQRIAVIGEPDLLELLNENLEAYSKVPPAAKNTNPRTTENTRPYNPNGRLNPV